MKKIYFSAILIVIAIGINTAQEIDDDFESYILGQPISGAHWTDWNCGGSFGCAMIASTERDLSGTNSALIPGDGTTSTILNLGNKTSDEWGVAFYLNIPIAKEAFFNLQGIVPVDSGESIVGNILFNHNNTSPGEGFIESTALGTVTFDFNHNQWFLVVINFDLTSGISSATWEMFINHIEIIPEGTALTNTDGVYPTSIGGINFASKNAESNYYFIEDVYYVDEFLDAVDFQQFGIDDFTSKGFSATPNPVNDVLNLSANEEINSVAIYNVLGQEIYKKDINALDATIDMSSYQKGIYILKAKIGDTEGSVKIIK